MAGPSIGKASLILTTDASGAKAGLAKFGADVKQFTEKTANQVNNQFRGAVLAGGLAGVLGGSLSGGVQENITALKEWVFGIDKLKIAAEALKGTVGQIVFLMQRNATEANEWRAAMTSPGERLASINQELAQIGRQQAALTAISNQAKADLAKLESDTFGRFTGNLGLSAHAEALKLMQEQVGTAGDGLRELHQRMDKLNQERRRLEDPWKFDPKVRGEFNRFLEEITDARLTAGMDAFEKKLLAFKKLNVPAEQLRELRFRIEELQAAELNWTRAKVMQETILATVGTVAAIPDAAFEARARAVQDTVSAAVAAVAEAAENPRELFRLASDNAALLAGTQAEISARNRNEFAGKGPAEFMVSEQKKTNGHLAEAVKQLQELPKKIAPALLAL